MTSIDVGEGYFLNNANAHLKKKTSQGFLLSCYLTVTLILLL